MFAHEYIRKRQQWLAHHGCRGSYEQHKSLERKRSLTAFVLLVTASTFLKCVRRL